MPKAKLKTSNAMTPQHASMQAKEWKLQVWDDFAMAVHVPTSHVFKLDSDFVQELQKLEAKSPAEAAEEYAKLKSVIPEESFKSKAPKKVNIQAIALNVAQSCNLRCTYCFAGDGDYGKVSLMDESIAVQSVRYFAANQRRFHVIFFGGEPLLNFRLIETVVADCLTKKDTIFTFSVTTNGTLLNDRHVEFFKKHQFTVNMSYDGKGLHKRQRLLADKVHDSESMVERKIQKYSVALSELRSMQLRATVSAKNLDYLRDAIINTLNSYQYKFLIGYHATPMRELAFKPEDIEKLANILDSVVNDLVEQKKYDQLYKLEPLRSHLTKIHKRHVDQSFCGAAINYLSVSTKGEFFVCHRFTEEKDQGVGSLTEGLNLEKLKPYAAHRNVEHAPCNGCWLREWCGGGCFHENKAANGTPFSPDPMFCRLQEAEMKMALRVYGIISEERPDLLQKL